MEAMNHSDEQKGKKQEATETHRATPISNPKWRFFAYCQGWEKHVRSSNEKSPWRNAKVLHILWDLLCAAHKQDACHVSSLI
jgi:hypothetical protein